MRWCFAIVALPLLAQSPSEYQGAMRLGVHALVARQYDDAVTSFQRAVDLAPKAVDPRLKLATALMRQYDPRGLAGENLAVANRCQLELLHAVELDPRNWTAAVFIGVLLLGEASGAADRDSRVRLVEESREWYRKAVAIDPRSRDYWTWAVRDAWSRWYPE